MSETGEMRGAVRADLAILGVFGAKMPFFEKKYRFSRKIAKKGLTRRIGYRKMKLLEVPRMMLRP